MTMGILSDISIDGDRCPNCGRPLHRHYDGYQRRRICDEGCAWYLQAQNECAEIKIRAERKGGELLREMGLFVGGECQMRITERREIEGIALARYYPKRLKRKHFFDEFSRDLLRFKRGFDVALIEKLSKQLAEIIRVAGRTFDLATHPPPSRQRLYYPCAHLAKAVATELDLDLLNCLRWADGKGESQKKRVGRMKLQRLGEVIECTSDITGLRVLLVDDILTTGLTAARCVEALTFAGAESVFCAILGWTVSEDTNGFQSVKFRRIRF